MIIKVFSILLVVFFTASCDGVIMSKKVKRPNGPIDGSAFSGNSFNKKDIRYTQGNLEYLNNRKARNNSVYFSSIEEYNVKDYQIAKEYIDDYQKFLKVDPDKLNEILQLEQSGKKNEDILRMMELGTLPKHPIENNVRVIQTLNDKYNKIAFPEYMNEFLNKNDNVDNNKKTEIVFENENNKEKEKTENIINKYGYNRDSYINIYLKKDNNKIVSKRYKEKKL